jgi:RNA polymerase sigma-70 factor, ECF subfamily
VSPESEAFEDRRAPGGETAEPETPGESFDFDGLYRDFGPRIWALIFGHTADRHLAQDVVQETFFRVYRYRKTLDPGRPLWPWLSAIAINAASTILKQIRPAPETPGAAGGEERAEWAVALGSDPAERYLTEEHARIVSGALRSLRTRHQRLLLLRDGQGWRYKDLADLEQSSVGSIKEAVRRARKRFREEYVALAQERGFEVPAHQTGRKNKLLGGFVFPAFVGGSARWVRRKLAAGWDQVQRASDSVAGSVARMAEAGTSPSWVAAGVLLVALGSGVVMGPAGGGVGPRGAGGPGAGGGGGAGDARAIGSRLGSPPGGPGSSPAGPLGDLTQTASSAAQKVADPSSEATPENTSFINMAPSPDYENDHTIFAAGDCYPAVGGACNALFVSQDGGSSWDRLPAEGFLGSMGGLFLAPRYPLDNRIFSVNHYGLQVSKDGGQSFTLALPYPAQTQRKNAAAIYPSAGSTSPQLVVIIQDSIFEYSADDQSLRPLMVSPNVVYAGYARSPDRSPFSLLISQDRWADRIPGLRRCADGICQTIDLGPSDLGINGIEFSPRFAEDSIVYVFGFGSDGGGNLGNFIFSSSDAARTFEPISAPEGDAMINMIHNVEPFPYPGGGGSLFVDGWENGIFRLNAGGSWTLLPVKVAGLEWPTILGTTPTGRMLVAGGAWLKKKGIACSSDGGLTWAPRCSPE